MSLGMSLGSCEIQVQARESRFAVTTIIPAHHISKDITMIPFHFNDGGRAAAGFKGNAGDCVARAVAIANGRPYREIYDRLAEGNATQRAGKNTRKRNLGRRTAREGIYTQRKWFKDYMAELGFVWHPTMHIGSGCTTHLRTDELPGGRLVVNVSKHSTAVIDGVLNDTYDCSRGGTRCVYGYWIKS